MSATSLRRSAHPFEPPHPGFKSSKPTCSAIASSGSGPSRHRPSRPIRTVADVLKKMVDERIGCVMVVDNGKLVGIFSERDALMKLNIDAAKVHAAGPSRNS